VYKNSSDNNKHKKAKQRKQLPNYHFAFISSVQTSVMNMKSEMGGEV